MNFLPEISEDNRLLHWDYLLYMSIMVGSVELGKRFKKAPEGLKKIEDLQERREAKENYYRNYASFIHAIGMIILSKKH